MRMFYSDKEVFYFDISVFNVGHVVRVHCKNNFYNIPNHNGYDFILDNDWDFNDILLPVLQSRLSKIALAWGKFCYDYESHDEFLKLYKLTPYTYKKLMTICEG